jgi:ABC-type transport system substrate-binding protein
MPIIKLITTHDESHYLNIARVVMAKPNPTKIDIYTLKFALSQPIKPQIFVKICEAVLSN